MSVRLLPCLFVAAVLPLGAAEAATKTTLHHFSGADGESPSGDLGFDASGALYGAASAIDPNSYGVIYRLAPPKAGQTLWSRQILHTFAGGVDGRRPYGGVTVSPNGIVYGTTMLEGPVNGTVFSLKPPATGGTAWTYRIIWPFKLEGPDGGVPWAPVRVIGGKLYGTTVTNQGIGSPWNGTVYELTQSKTAPTGWSEKIVTSNIEHPEGDVVPDGTGRLYVAPAVGAVQRLTPPATAAGAWTTEFLFEPPGLWPTQLILSGNGRIWGAVISSSSPGKGAVYYADPPATAGGTWTVKMIWTFTGGTDGGYPQRLIRVGNTLYGTTSSGGAGGAGTVFSLSPPTRAGAAWNLTTLHAFADGVDGATPTGLVFADGKLFGTTYRGGKYSKGTVFSITP